MKFIQNKKITFLALTFFSVSFIGCGKGVTAGTSAQISFSGGQKTASFDLMKILHLIPSAYATIGVNEPAYFAAKFLSAYLVEEVGSDQGNVGQVQKIYLNPACPLDGCASADDVTTFFEFSRPASEVNAEINGQKRIVDDKKVFSYKYVRLDFCIGGGKNNVKFKETASSTEVLMDSNNCGVTSRAMDPPLTINPGDQVVITLDYTLEGIMNDCPVGGNYTCSENKKYVNFPAFVPSAKKL